MILYISYCRRRNSVSLFFSYIVAGIALFSFLGVHPWSNLYKRFTHQKEGNQRGHVAGCPRPFDRPAGRPRSDKSRHFAKKPLNSGKIKPAVHPPLSGFFIKKPSIFAQIVPAVHAFTWACLPIIQWDLVGRIQPEASFLYLLEHLFTFSFYEKIC